jgi:flagellin FlaB
MKNLITKFTNRTNPLLRDQRGITGLETAIVLIAFVVVSSVFAFAALSTGLFTTDKAKETIKAGLSEARGTMELKGSVLAAAAVTGNSGTVDTISFQVSNAAAGEAIDMTAGNTIIKYTDNNQTKNLDTSSLFTATEVGSGDGDSLLERGEVFEVIILDMVGLLDTDLGTDTTFTLEVVPPKGAVLFIQRNTPVSFETINSLD